MRRVESTCVGCVALGVLSIGWAGSDTACTSDRTACREWHFEVLLDGKPIGQHDFLVSGTEEATEVVSRARFVVTALRIPVYRYEHEAHERWRGGCLMQMDATTSDNGRPTIVHGSVSQAGFALAGPHGASALSGCVRSFVYWNPQLLQASRLLNPQTGEYVPVQVARVPDGAAGAEQHYRIDGANLHIDLWYGASGEWRALESRTAEGRTLRYDLRS